MFLLKCSGMVNLKVEFCFGLLCIFRLLFISWVRWCDSGRFRLVLFCCSWFLIWLNFLKMCFCLVVGMLMLLFLMVKMMWLWVLLWWVSMCI